MQHYHFYEERLILGLVVRILNDHNLFDTEKNFEILRLILFSLRDKRNFRLWLVPSVHLNYFQR